MNISFQFGIYKFCKNIIIDRIIAGMIRKLPQHVINQISAGQVIQRPFNVIKQLVENSIDAGASQININIQQGGLKLIKISDNGKGIMVEDFPLLCARFATSKIKDFGDMASLNSFGFRGEALASLSYVSNLTISSKWQKDTVGHTAQFKNQQIVGKIIDIPMNTGTTITALDLFTKLQNRRASLNPMQQKKKIYKLLSHFCLHNPQIRFSFITQKGDQNLPRSKPDVSLNQAKMQIFQQITKLSYDKFSYVASCKVGHGAQVQAIMTKINCCKGKTLLLNINNRIVQNVQLFKSIQKAYSQCYQSIHQQNQSFFVYLSLKIQPKLIDCNVHPTKKAVGLFASQQTYQSIRQMILNQIKRDSAIKIIKPNLHSQKNLNIQQSIRQKMGLSLLLDHNKSQTSDPKSKTIYAYQKNRTDSKQLPITYYSQPQTQRLQGIEQCQYFTYLFEQNERNVELRKFFGDCTYVGCYGLNCILIHYTDKLYMLNIVQFLPSFIYSHCQTNKLYIKQVRKDIKIQQQIQNFINKTKLLPDSEKVISWISQQKNEKLILQKFGIQIKNMKLIAYPCLGDIFIECLDQDNKIGWQIAYLLCRVYNSVNIQKLNKKLEDKFMRDFISAQFIEQSEDLSPFNEKISNFFKNRVIPVLKTNPILVDSNIQIKKYMKQMLDLKDIYKIFQRC